MTKAVPEIVDLSVLDLFSLGIGPLCSPMTAPMRAALRFAELALASGRPNRVWCELFGTFAQAGKAYATDSAIILGLSGFAPERVDPEVIPRIIDNLAILGTLNLNATCQIPFCKDFDIIFREGEVLPGPANALRFHAEYLNETRLSQTFFSIGGGGILQEGSEPARSKLHNPYRFSSTAELLYLGKQYGMSISDAMLANEDIYRPRKETERFVDKVRQAMFSRIERGCRHDGFLPGGLNAKRRAKALFETLKSGEQDLESSSIFEWVRLYALAVDEEIAAEDRVATAPTTSTAGVLPAVLKFYEAFTARPTIYGSRSFLMTAGAIGLLHQKKRLVSAPEMGCQGEIGVACSMAAAGLTAAHGGANVQVVNAADMGMGRSLELTCDLVGDLAHLPFTECGAQAAVRAISAAYLALKGDGSHNLSKEAVIETLCRTGSGINSEHKERVLAAWP